MTRAAIRPFREGTATCLCIIGVALAAGLAVPQSVRGADQPDQLITGKKLLVKKHATDPSKHKVVFLSKDTSFELPDGTNDPRVVGAVLHIVDLGVTAGTAAIALPAADWRAINGGFKYKGSPGAPCKSAIIKDDKLVKVVCKGPSVTVTPPFAGAAAVALQIGTTTIRYCATFGGTVSKNTVKLFKAKTAPEPAACLSCGNGSVEPGEQCDDGNNANGDCCSATCKFEASGSGCTDGNACTLNDMCNGAGTCSGGPTCGNDIVEAGCGEQCDGSTDAACPGLCLFDCTCLAAPLCDGDPGRTAFIGTETACENITTQTLCNSAYVLDDAGVTSCHWDGSDCTNCTPQMQADGECINECHPPLCLGDGTRTLFVGGPGTQPCHIYDGDQASCEQAFHQSPDGSASCWYDTGADECNGCGSQNQANGLCVNSCATCPADATRTLFAGGPDTQACRQYDGDQTSCEQAFHRTGCGTSASCYYDTADDVCRGCGPDNEDAGACRNTCVAGPFACTNDPARTTFVGGPNTSACHTYDGDYVGCAGAFHRDQCGTAVSCYFDFSDSECRGCGPNNMLDGVCVNTCRSGPVTCPADPSRTYLAGFPGSSGCQEFGVVAGTAACDTAFNVGQSGVASCYYDADNDRCQGCGAPNEGDGLCVNACKSGPVACPADPTRTVFAGGPQTSACHQFDGNQSACEQAFHLGQCGVSSCFYDSGQCMGCGPNNEQNGDCSNTCAPPSCPGDVTRTVFAGGPQASACHQFDGNQGLCLQAYHLGQDGVASCYYDADDDECRGCGPSNAENGDCVNTCPVCAQDASRTIFAGGPNNQACHQFDGNKPSCLAAFHANQCHQSTSCYYDDAIDECMGCGPNNSADGNCIETCGGGLAVACVKDPSRTVYAGGPNTAACHQYDGDPTTCGLAFHRGNDGFASCFYDYEADECLGCGPTNENNGACSNTCKQGPPTCANDATRTRFLGGPGNSGCHQFDNDQAGCEQSFLFSECFEATSCFWDADNSECRGCGPNNLQDGLCTNTCRSGAQTCAGDSSRTIFAGGPQTGACHDFDNDQLACLSAYHRGQCGTTSCYWDGFGCSGCGPNNLSDSNCFDTCQSPQ